MLGKKLNQFNILPDELICYICTFLSTKEKQYFALSHIRALICASSMLKNIKSKEFVSGLVIAHAIYQKYINLHEIKPGIVVSALPQSVKSLVCGKLPNCRLSSLESLTVVYPVITHLNFPLLKKLVITCLSNITEKEIGELTNLEELIVPFISFSNKHNLNKVKTLDCHSLTLESLMCFKEVENITLGLGQNITPELFENSKIVNLKITNNSAINKKMFSYLPNIIRIALFDKVIWEVLYVKC